MTSMQSTKEIEMADSPWEMWSAIGTITAVVVALGISCQAAWVTRKADKDRSELASAKMLSPLSELERKASYLFAWFCFNDGEHKDQYMPALLAIQELDVLAKSISIEDLYPLLHLKNHAAKRSARALGLIRTFSGDTITILMHHSWSNVEQRETHQERWRGMLSEIKDHLAVAVMACDEAASTGAPRPTQEEIQR